MVKLKARLSKTNKSTVDRVRIDAGKCAQCNTSHMTRIYTTKGRVRYCACDNCGHSWQKDGPLANPLVDLASEAAELLSNADVVKTETDAEEVVIVNAKTAADLVNRIVSAMP